MIFESLWTSRICLCSLSHNQVFFICGITNEAVVNDTVINPSQINAYVHIQLLSHTNTCIIPENPITVWRSWSDYRTWLTLHNYPARVSMLFATCFHRAMRCTGHSPDTATLTEDVSLFGLFEELIVAGAQKLKTLLINLDCNHPMNSNITMTVNQEREWKHANCFGNTADEPCQASQPVHAFSCVTSHNTSPWIELTMRNI